MKTNTPSFHRFVSRCSRNIIGHLQGALARSSSRANARDLTSILGNTISRNIVGRRFGAALDKGRSFAVCAAQDDS
jgi:hypothetical protein